MNFLSLPTLPCEDEIRRAIPRIDPISDNLPRPFWSVMIPTYNRPDYLGETLESVLSQDQGSAAMQIEVVDNCSTVGDIAGIVHKIGGCRVGYFRQPQNVSFTDNWNTCVTRARGHWIHIMHDDDLLLPGFYEAYHVVINKNPEIVMVAGKIALIDLDKRWQFVMGPDPSDGQDLISNFADRCAPVNIPMCPAVVVRRVAYESVGGFSKMFGYHLDWEQWFRIGMIGPIAGTRRPYLLHRVHPSRLTHSSLVSADNVYADYLVAGVNLSRLHNGELPRDTFVRWKQSRARKAQEHAWELDREGSIEGRLNQFRRAFALDPSVKTLILVLKSWLKLKWSRQRTGSFSSVPPCL